VRQGIDRLFNTWYAVSVENNLNPCRKTGVFDVLEGEEMRNLSIDFDTYFFRPLDLIRVAMKKLFTKFCLRDTQSCKHCGRDQSIAWTVEDEYWERVPGKYRDKALCLECFCRMAPEVRPENFILLFNTEIKRGLNDDGKVP